MTDGSFRSFTIGRVAGWGKTASGGAPSEVLKKVELPVVDKAQCIAESDIGFRPNITPDKFCAGLLNSNVSVCQGQIINYLLLLVLLSLLSLFFITVIIVLKK